MSRQPKLARVGDTIECDIRHPFSRKIRMRLETTAAAAHASDLLMDPKSGWRLSPLPSEGEMTGGVMEERKMVSVDAKALYEVLQALLGPPHYIRELQMTRGIAALTGDDPIQTLVDDFNRALQPEDSQ